MHCCAATAAAAAVHRLGAGVKVINCVLMDGVVVADGSHIQNCVVCSGAVVQERATLKDCQVRIFVGRNSGCSGPVLV